eukprot:TRINITY_DN109_c1_g1_i1.p1 TRINITY_DN109_c1_g1~~TRINITY_DN109_c1_g1_i1.p1  ORF type:complete len:564 (-),score=161.84 TRINITY_DN109_c1_g1_i1:114-1805(-)
MSGALPIRFSIRIKSRTDLDLFATFIWPPRYPCERQKVVLRWGSLTGLSDPQIAALESLIDKMCTKAIETVSLIEAIEKWVNETLGDEEGGNESKNSPNDAFRDVMGISYEVINPEMVVKQQNQMVESVSKELKVPKRCSFALLSKYRWNQVEVKAKYSEAQKGDKLEEFLCSVAGNNPLKEGHVYTPESFTKKYECSVCYDDFELKDVTGLGCDHFFCNDCFTSYLSVAITGGTDVINCPGHKCKEPVDLPTIVSLLPNLDLYRKYVSFVMKTFVSKAANIVWCPSEQCENAINVKSSYTTFLQCSCYKIWCTDCEYGFHWPLNCDQAKWAFKGKMKEYSDRGIQLIMEDVGATNQWIKKMTSKCPSCRSNIQKNGGCNHMTCPTCHHQFCWECFENWKSEHYSCRGRNGRRRDEHLDPNWEVDDVLSPISEPSTKDLLAINEMGRGADNALRKKYTQKFFVEKNVPNKEALVVASIKAMESIIFIREMAINTVWVAYWMLSNNIAGVKKWKHGVSKLDSMIETLNTFLDPPLKNMTEKDLKNGIQLAKKLVKELRTTLVSK